MKNLVKNTYPSITYVIHGANGNPDKTVTAYKPTMAYYLVFELIKFRKLPVTFHDVGITVLTENIPVNTNSDSNNPDFNNH